MHLNKVIVNKLADYIFINVNNINRFIKYFIKQKIDHGKFFHGNIFFIKYNILY